MKKLISMFITGAMLLTAFPTVSAAVQTNPGYTTEQPAVKTDAVSLPTLDVGDESAFKGYTLPNVSAGERENADSLADKTGSASVGAGISFSVKGDTLTITGSGSMQGLMDNREYPWSDKASGVKHIVIQNGITDIYSYAFMDFKSLESISVPSSVTSIGEGAFYECSRLKEIVLPSSVKKIGSGAFCDCSSLQKAQISGVTEIGDYAFESTDLSTITLGKDLKQFSGMAFFGSHLTDIKVDSANTSLKAINGVLYNKAMDTLLFYPPRKAGKTFQVPASVKTIGSCAFCRNLYLESVDLSAAVTLKDSAFQECYALNSIVIPDSVTSAEDFTFYSCPALKSVTFGKGLKTTGYQMFRECKKLAQINFGGLQEIYAMSFGDCSSLESVSLPASVKSIGNGAFGNCRALKSVYAAEVTVIPYQAFLNDNLLNSVSFPKLKNVNRAAFLGCSSLKKVSLPKSTEFVHSIAFEKDVQLTCANAALKPYGYNGLRKLQQVALSGDESYSEAFSVLTLVNQERSKNGLKPLVMNQSLMDTAMLRAAECAVCFSHTRPNGSTCMSANTLMSGENIAFNQKNADDVMNSWMNSTGHRENILSGDYTTIGVGCFKNNGIITWVQCFGTGSDTASCKKPSDKHVTRTLQLATEEFTEATDSDYHTIFGSLETYSFHFFIRLDGFISSMETDQTVQARLCVSNSQYPYIIAVLDNTGITWSVKDTGTVSVTSGGMVTAKAPGDAEIEAKLTYYSAAKTIRVYQKNPVIQKVENTGSGISLQWNNCYGADRYIVYYRPESEKEWDYDYTYDTSYTLNHLNPGVCYCFQVCAHSYYDNTNYYSNVVSKTYEIPPSLSLSNNSAGLTAAWSSTGADSYVVYYRPAERSTWSSFTATGNNAVIPNTESGKLYCVQVQNIFNGKNGAYSKVKSMTYIAQPTITGLSYNGNNTLTWNNINGANKYQIARKKTGDTAYTYFTTTATSFTEKNISAGVTYTYQVRAMYETANNGTAYGAWSGSKSVETIVKPVLTLSNKSNGIRAEWNAISGAAKYIVYYRRNADSNWSSVTTYNNYYPLLGLTAGTYYAVQVQAVYNNGDSLYSSVNRLTYIPQVNPVLTLSNKSNGIRAEWDKIPGATKYIVYYRRNSDSKWSSTTTSNNYYPLLNLTAGTQYAVQVQAVFGSANGLYSSVNRLTYIPQIQTNVSLSNRSNGIRAEWNQVPGATDYIVYYKPSGASWSSITTKNNYFAYLNTKSGTLYCVQVQPVFNGSKGLYSQVKSMTFIAQPSLSAIKQSNNVKLSWNSISGANKYQIATKKTSESNYRYITVTGTSYVDTAAKSGENEYQVRAMYATSNNGTAYGYWSNIAYVTK